MIEKIETCELCARLRPREKCHLHRPLVGRKIAIERPTEYGRCVFVGIVEWHTEDRQNFRLTEHGYLGLGRRDRLHVFTGYAA